MGNIFAALCHQLQREGIRIHRIVITEPAQGFVHHTEWIFIKVHHVALQLLLVEEKVHEAAGIFILKIEIKLARLFAITQKVFPQNLACCVHAQSRGIKQFENTLDLSFFAERHPLFLMLFPGLHAGLVDSRNEAKLNLVWNLLGRTFVDTFDTVVPCRNFSLLLPVAHATLNILEVRNRVHEVGVTEVFLIKGVGQIIPEFQDITRRNRPELQRFVTRDLPTGIQAHHIVIVDFALDDISTVTLLHPENKIRLLVIELAIKLLLDEINDGRVVKFVGRLGKIFSAVKSLEHGRKHDSSSGFLVLGRAAAKPTITLESQRGAMHSALFLYPSLNEEVITKNLCYCPFFLKMLTAFAGSFRETIEEIQCRPVRVECGHVTSHYRLVDA